MRTRRFDDRDFQYGRIETLKDKIDKILEISSSIVTLSSHIPDIEAIKDKDLNGLRMLSDNLNKLKVLYDELGNFNVLYQNIDDIREIRVHMPLISKAVQSAIQVEETMRSICAIEKRADLYANKAMQFRDDCEYKYQNEYVPALNEVRSTAADLQHIIDTTLASIIAGHNKAGKFFDYETVVKTCPMSYEEGAFMTIDDEHRQIIFTLPEPFCGHITEVDPQVVRESVDAYMDTLPNVGGLSDDLKKLIDANTQIGQNTGDANNVVLRNPLWAATGVTDYPDEEQLYFAFLRQTNTGSMKMKVDGRTEYPVKVLDADGNHIEVPANYVKPNNLYIFKLCSKHVGC